MGFFSQFSGNKKDEKKPTKKAAVVTAKTKTKKKDLEADLANSSAATASDATRPADVAADTTSNKPESVQAAIGIGSVKYIIKPLITEQGTYLAENNTYLFQVALQANKRAIREAIEKIYGVKVVAVRTTRYLGKKVRYGRVAGQRSAFKKAFVTVAKGQTIVVNKNV